MGNVCQVCGAPAVRFSKYDTFACVPCDVWTERPHGAEGSCTPTIGCDVGFLFCPERPSMVPTDARSLEWS